MDQPLNLTKPVTVLFHPEELVLLTKGIEELPFKFAKPLLDKVIDAAKQAHAEDKGHEGKAA